MNNNDDHPLYTNKLIMLRLFKLKPGSKSYKDESQRITLREVKYQILNDEMREQQMEMINLVRFTFPLEIYDDSMTYYENEEQLMQRNFNYNWSHYAPDYIVYSVQYIVEGFGCYHYCRGAQVQCFTCKKFYPCRLCHDDCEDHEMPRRQTVLFRCHACGNEQPPAQTCSACGVQFACYYCDTCKLLCDIGPEAKPNFHCDECNICLVGLRQFTRHCAVCGYCYSSHFFAEHKCQRELGCCVVCLAKLRNSTYPHQTLPCGHNIHQHCCDALVRRQNFSCPVCKRFMLEGADRKHFVACARNLYVSVFPLAFGLQRCQCNDCGAIYVFMRSQGGYYCPRCANFNLEEINGDATAEEYHETVNACGDMYYPSLNMPSIERFLRTLRPPAKYANSADNMTYLLYHVTFPAPEVMVMVCGFLASKRYYRRIDKFTAACERFMCAHTVIEEEFEFSEEE